MKFTSIIHTGDIIHGFRVDRVVPVEELSATLYQMVHEKTGLQLIWLKRADENKTFGIAFPTIPFDDSGVFHILEHTVLCGSKRFPVKEPFVELLKTSVNTFMNAMTFPDKTLYPFCSRNDKDFVNLLRVYMDAVFNPRITIIPEIFRQEGWHYEFAEDGTPSYKGVVFNEMKGAFADADRQETMALDRAMYPDSPYRFVSGGDPACIPSLTYEKYLETYHKFYSPSNGYVFLDGDLDIDAVLAIMDDEYLSGMEAGERIAPPAIQPPVKGTTAEIDYAVSEDEKDLPRTKLALGNIVGRFDEQDKLLGLRVLADVLTASNQSPLCKAILEKGLAEEVSLSVQDSAIQASVVMEALNFEEKDREEIERLMFAELKKQADGALDHEQIEAALVSSEFQTRERDFGSYPQGLVMGISVITGWMYGGLPEDELTIGDRFDRLRAKIDTGYFEQLIRDHLLEHEETCRVIMHPSAAKAAETIAAEKKRLQQAVSQMSEETKEGLKAQQEKLLAWQSTEDTAEQLATLPKLKLEDISAEPDALPCVETAVSGIKTLLHPLGSNGIVYLRLYFDLGQISREKWQKLALATCLLGDVHTQKHNEMELENSKRLLTGFLDFDTEDYPQNIDGKACYKLSVNVSALKSKAAEALKLAVEILTESVFDEESDIMDILRQEKTTTYQHIVMSGSSAAIGRLAAQISECGAADEYVTGVEWYRWLKQIDEDEGLDFPELAAGMEAAVKEAADPSRLVFSVTGDVSEEADKEWLEELADVLKTIPSPADAAETSFDGQNPSECGETEHPIRPWGIRKEGIIVPAEIAFAVRGGDFTPYASYSGSMQLAQKVVSLAYLWNEIRVKGGAYGSGMLFRRSGIAGCYSYRDPNGARSLQTYEGCGSFLKNFAESGSSLDGYIIGTVADHSPLRTARMTGRTADQVYFQQISEEDRQKIRRELLAADSDSLAALAEIIDKTIANGGFCVIGGQEQIEKCKPETVIRL